MSKVPVKDSKPELIVRKFLFSQGYRFRKNYKPLPGTPDIVLPKLKIAIFIHGCFWHAHKRCKYAKVPSTNILFWTDKFDANVRRDRKKTSQLKSFGWKVLIIWQCDLKNPKLNGTLERLGSRIAETEPKNIPRRKA